MTSSDDLSAASSQSGAILIKAPGGTGPASTARRSRRVVSSLNSSVSGPVSCNSRRLAVLGEEILTVM